MNFIVNIQFMVGQYELFSLNLKLPLFVRPKFSGRNSLILFIWLLMICLTLEKLREICEVVTIIDTNRDMLVIAVNSLRLGSVYFVVW